MREITCSKCGITKSVDEFPSTGRCCRVCAKALDTKRDLAQTLRHGGQPRPPQPGSSTIAERRAMLHLVKTAIGCAECHQTGPVQMLQFDHLPAYCKSFDISWGVIHPLRITDRRLIEEVLKCDVVCVKCHTRRTAWRRRNGVIVTMDADRNLYR